MERKLRYHEYLEPFTDYIGKNFKKCNNEVFRTFCSFPITEIDIIPRLFRVDEDKIPRTFTKEEVEGLSEAQKERIVGSYALSVNNSMEACVSNALHTYRKLVKRGIPKDVLEEWKSNRGNLVLELNSSADLGLISEFDQKGHGNLLLYEDVDTEILIKPGSEAIIIRYEDEDDQ